MAYTSSLPLHASHGMVSFKQRIFLRRQRVHDVMGLAFFRLRARPHQLDRTSETVEIEYHFLLPSAFERCSVPS